MNGNKFATGEIPKKPVEVVKGRILAGRAQKSPEPCVSGFHMINIVDAKLSQSFNNMVEVVLGS
jgi:hypothetical protein